MIEKIVEIAEPGVRLHVKNDQLVIESSRETGSVPMCEVAVLVLSHPRAELTHAALSRVAENGGTTVLCDDHFLPAGMMLPMQSHYVQTERFRRQVTISEPLRKRLWQEVVRAKIRAQGELLLELTGSDQGLKAMSPRVRSGDPENLEAQAARRYWQQLFPTGGFHRSRHGDDQNRHLNYGYTMLRAVVARALCAAGLHPSFGIQHRNRYDPFCLASDLMEPMRPTIDRIVSEWLRDHDRYAKLDKESKAALAEAITCRYEIDGEVRTLFDASARIAQALAAVICGQSPEFRYPGLRPCREKEQAASSL